MFIKGAVRRFSISADQEVQAGTTFERDGVVAWESLKRYGEVDFAVIYHAVNGTNQLIVEIELEIPG
jgi:hypothetical protein